MSNKFSDILKDRTIFTQADENWIHEQAKKEAQTYLKQNESTDLKKDLIRE